MLYAQNDPSRNPADPPPPPDPEPCAFEEPERRVPNLDEDEQEEA